MSFIFRNWKAIVFGALWESGQNARNHVAVAIRQLIDMYFERHPMVENHVPVQKLLADRVRMVHAMVAYQSFYFLGSYKMRY